MNYSYHFCLLSPFYLIRRLTSLLICCLFIPVVLNSCNCVYIVQVVCLLVYDFQTCYILQSLEVHHLVYVGIPILWMLSCPAHNILYFTYFSYIFVPSHFSSQFSICARSQTAGTSLVTWDYTSFVRLDNFEQIYFPFDKFTLLWVRQRLL